jgi:hypothetical protein
MHMLLVCMGAGAVGAVAAATLFVACLRKLPPACTTDLGLTALGILFFGGTGGLVASVGTAIYLRE